MVVQISSATIPVIALAADASSALAFIMKMRQATHACPKSSSVKKKVQNGHEDGFDGPSEQAGMLAVTLATVGMPTAEVTHSRSFEEFLEGFSKCR